MNTLLLVYKQGHDPFWKKKPQEKAAKPSRPKTKAVKKTTKRKAPECISMELDDDPDEPEVEVELDSLGSLFMHLIDNDTYQEDVEGSQADDVEVITLSSGSDSMPTQKTRQAVQKVSFSHPLAHLDPTFILKKQQNKARRTTDATAKRSLQPVYRTPRFKNADLRSHPLLTLLIPRQAISDNVLIPSIRIIR